MKRSQEHGFTWESQVLDSLGLSSTYNNTNKYDGETKTEYISIKTVQKGRPIDCGDILRFFNRDKEKHIIIIVVEYIQENNFKVFSNLYIISYDDDMHALLWGDIKKSVLEQYVKGVKSIPTNIDGNEARKIFSYLERRDEIISKYNLNISITPKVSKSQSRVQCSINNWKNKLDKFMIKPPSFNKIFNNIDKILESPPRQNITVKMLKIECKKLGLKGYSKLRKKELQKMVDDNLSEELSNLKI